MGPLVARILLAQLFIVSGIGKAMLFAKTAAYMSSMGLPASQILLVLTVLLEVGGGVLLLAGWRARWIATAFFCFTLVTTLVFHAFWSADAAGFPGQLNNFMKNFAIMGGMLYVIAYGAGPLSVGRDECRTETNVETRPATPLGAIRYRSQLVDDNFVSGFGKSCDRPSKSQSARPIRHRTKDAGSVERHPRRRTQQARLPSRDGRLSSRLLHGSDQQPC